MAAPTDVQALLHSQIDPAFFSTTFRPMSQLVSILSAEAHGRGAADEESDGASTDDEDAVVVHTLEGATVRLRGLNRASTVDELRAAVRRRLGAGFEDQRLYVSPDAAALLTSESVARLDLLTDGGLRLGACGVFREGAAAGDVHLRNRAYETLRTQLQVATDAVEHLLAAHYDKFHESVESVQRMARQYQALKRLNGEARGLVDDCRDRLGLRAAPDPLTAEEDAPRRGGRVLEHWEAQVEAEEALRLLAELRARVS
mmetsp:Transcript_29481/g.88163  ORF Transcript_29481/g.88163 Transcript_29481/m.88163 type:complete len:258 (-) Transcript_29481:15-788(-)